MSGLTFLVYYIIGYFITLLVLIMWGKKLGFDYDVEETYANYDNWGSNASAYPGISFAWPMLLIVGVIISIWMGLSFLTFCLLELRNRER